MKANYRKYADGYNAIQWHKDPKPTVVTDLDLFKGYMKKMHPRTGTIYQGYDDGAVEKRPRRGRRRKAPMGLAD